MKLLSILSVFFVGLRTFAQQTVSDTLSPAQQRTDFLLVANALDQYHPSAYRFVSRDSMQHSVSAVLAGLNGPLSRADFHLVVRRFITQVHCGHTVAQPSVEWYSQQRTSANMPLRPLLAGDRLYFATALTTDSLLAGKEILSINGRNALDILNDMRAIHTRDGYSETFTDYSISEVFQTYYIFLYGSASEYTVLYRNGNETASVLVKNKKDIAGTYPARKGLEAYPVIVSNAWSNLYIDYADSTAILQIRGFDRSHYKRQYKKVFRTLKQEHLPNLVIDLRDNGGGYFPNGNVLLSYISKDPVAFRFNRTHKKPEKNQYLHMNFISRMTRSLFHLLPDPVDNDSLRTYEITYKPKTTNHFNGNLYVLTNGGSFSMSGYVSAFLKHRTNAILIGQETGGGEEGSNALLFQTLMLPNSKIRVNIPYYHLDHQLQGIASERGVMPDIAVSYTVDDLLKGRDRELQVVLDDVRKRNASR